MRGKSEDQEKLMKTGAVVLGGFIGGFFGGPLGAGVGAAGALWIADEMLKGHKTEYVEDPHFRQSDYLVLVVRFTNQKDIENIHDLPLGENLSEKYCMDLFKYTRYLWRGNKDHFNSTFLPLIKGEGSDSESEYNVFLIALQVDAGLSGLSERDDSMDRRDAFMQMAGKARIVAVSRPLNPDVYSGKGFYKLV
jgi:hypothetical protein